MRIVDATRGSSAARSSLSGRARSAKRFRPEHPQSRPERGAGSSGGGTAGIDWRQITGRAAGDWRRQRSTASWPTAPRRGRAGCRRRRPHSPAREAAGIATSTRSYPQAALVLNFAHSREPWLHLDRIPHRDRAVHAGAAAGQPLEPGLGGEAAKRPRNWRRWTMPRCRAGSRSRCSRCSAA